MAALELERRQNAKIRLSEADQASVDLGFVETNLAVSLTRSQLAAASEKLLAHLRSLLDEVLAQGSTRLDLVYLTGGSANPAV